MCNNIATIPWMIVTVTLVTFLALTVFTMQGGLGTLIQWFSYHWNKGHIKAEKESRCRKHSHKETGEMAHGKV